MRKSIILLILIAGGIVGIAMATAKRGAPHPTAIRQQSVDPSVRPDAIDGAKNPELIPNRVAYALLFRLIANRQTDVEKNRIRAYIRQMGLGEEASGAADVDALLAAAEEFQQRAGLLDREAKAIKERNRTTANPAVAAQLAELQRRKEDIVEEIVASMPNRLSTPGVEIVRQHVNERVKRKVKFHLPRPNDR